MALAWRIRIAIRLARWIGGPEYTELLGRTVMNMAAAVQEDGNIILLREVQI